MSGSITSLLNTFTQALGFGSYAPVVLGDFSFTQFEVPEKINFGGKQKLNIHMRPGGQRQIDVIGPEDHDLAWTGIFLSADAASRAQQLDDMRVLGDAIDLTWGPFSYRVVISEYEASYIRLNYVTYRITVSVLRQNVATSGPTLLGSVVDDLNNALGINLSADLSAVSNSLNQITPLVSAVTVLTGASPAALNIATAVQSAQGVTSGLLQTANGNIFGLNQVAANFTTNSRIATSLAALSAAVNTAPALTSVGNILGRMNNNLTNPETG